MQVAVHRRCVLCGSGIVPQENTDAIGAVCFYESICRECARTCVLREIPAETELTFIGEAMLDNADAKHRKQEECYGRTVSV
jgi:hypothetical protein